MKTMHNEEVPSEAWDSVWRRGRLMDAILAAGTGVYNFFWRSLLRAYATKSTNMIELGCGVAVLALSLKDDISTYTGVDYSQEAIKLAKENAQQAGVANYSFIEQDVFALDPSLRGSFDLVWSQGLIEHFSSYEPIIRAHYDLLAPGGTALISVPYKYSYHTLWHIFTRPAFLRRFYPWNETHVKFLTRNDLRTPGEHIDPASAKVFFLPPAPLGFLLGIAILRLKKPSTS